MALGIELRIDTVELMEQLGVVRHELIFSMRHVDRRQRQVVVVKLTDEPLQGHRVPHYLQPWLVMYRMNGLLHIGIGYGIGAPATLHHQMMAESTLMDYHLVLGKVTKRLYLGLFGFPVSHTMGEDLHHRLTTPGIVRVEIGIHAQGQVGLAFLQVGQGFLARLQLNNIRYAKLLEDEPEHIHIIAHRFTIIIKERVRTQVPGILVDQRVVFRKLSFVFFVCIG